MYLDFDGFFASVEQECNRRLRGGPPSYIAVLAMIGFIDVGVTKAE